MTEQGPERNAKNYRLIHASLDGNKTICGRPSRPNHDTLNQPAMWWAVPQGLRCWTCDENLKELRLHGDS